MTNADDIPPARVSSKCVVYIGGFDPRGASYYHKLFSQQIDKHVKKQDLAVANQGSNTVSILLGAGNGTFGSKIDWTTGSAPESVAVGDFNRDGKPDLAVANLGDNTVSVATALLVEPALFVMITE